MFNFAICSSTKNPITIAYLLPFSRVKFFNIVKETCSDSFKVNMDKVLGHLTMSGNVKDDTVRSLLFGDYMNPEGARVYDEVTDLKELSKAMDQ